jgi:hypothetical protein
MKLYTEEQMRRCYAGVLQNVGTCIKQSDLPKEDEYINSLTPIELPSDDDICDEAESIAHNYFVMQRNHYQGLEEGAKRMAYWLMKHFKQQNNDNRN